MNLSSASPKAALLPPNFTWRSYAGGSVLRSFRGIHGTPDDHFPEDWLASMVRARNGSNSRGPDEGLSRVMVHDREALLTDALAEDPGYWWGEQRREHTGVLWKLLDASGRLHFQAHPDKAFARARLNSNAGKTECWYILETRGPASVYLGFQRSPGRAAWAEMIHRQRVDNMLLCFDEIPVQKGDCFVVPAGMPHAIGAGVFMMELQEPTDWVVRCEQVNAGVRLPPEACFMGLDLEACLDVFNYNQYSVAEVIKRYRQEPQVLRCCDDFLEEEIISPSYAEFFRLRRLRGAGRAHWSGGELLLMVVLAGEGAIRAVGSSRQVRAGETWLLPGAADHWELESPGRWEVLLAGLPVISIDSRTEPPA